MTALLIGAVIGLALAAIGACAERDDRDLSFDDYWRNV